MRKSKIMKWNGKEVTCKELTVAEIDQLLSSAPPPNALDLVFGDRIPTAAVTMSTGLQAADLESESPSLLDELWSGVEEVNPFFVPMLDRLAKAGSNLVK